ncbi:MAG: tetratricopeptide repeat protein [Planctomycetota bacterium]|jgi:Flp pilus assembly protein TadD/glycosyltransferase involved in cell wall biosynthesis
MLDNPQDELYRTPNEDPIPIDQMSEEEVELRRLLSAYSKDPEDLDTLMKVTRILMQKQLYEEARLYLDPYVEKVPDDPEALNYSGIIRFTAGDFEEAERFFERALALSADFTDALYNSAMLYSERGDFDNARAQFEKLTSLENDNPEVFNNLGALLYQNGKWEEAESHFRQALEMDPENAPALRNLIEVLLDAGRGSEAEDLLIAYEKTDPPREELDAVKRRFVEPASTEAKKPAPYGVNEPERKTIEAGKGNMPSTGLTVGIVSDWCPGDRGYLAWWIWWSLTQHGHEVHVLTRNGRVPHCGEQDRTSFPRYLGHWVVPNFTYCQESPLPRDRFSAWISEIRPDTVVFVDEVEPGLVEEVHAADAAAIACPAMVGATRSTASSYDIFDTVLCTSPWIQEAFEGKIPADRLVPCDLGVDMNRFYPRSREGREIVFLFDAGYGSTEELENLLILLSSFSLMKREAIENARLLIRTQVEWHLLPQEIRTRGEGRPHIDVISGQVDDHHFLGMGDVLVHLKLGSGIHWIVPEAAACGIPSIVVDGSPATGWIFDEKMILKVPRSLGRSNEDVPAHTTDVKILADTLSTLASDPEMVDYMGEVCREKTRQLLEGMERGQNLCDKIVTAVTAVRGNLEEDQDFRIESERIHLGTEPQPQGPDRLLKAIETAISDGDNDQAKVLMMQYRQSLE